MDSFFGIGLPELVLILLLAGLVMGPHRIREVARIFGRVTAQVQRISREFARQLNSELDAVSDGELKSSLNDMRVLQEEVEALRKELAQVPRSFREVTDSIAAEGRDTVDSAKAAMTGAKLSPTGEDAPEDGQELSDVDSTSRDDEQLPLPRAIDVPEDPEI